MWIKSGNNVPRRVVRPRAVERPGVAVHEGVVGTVAVGPIAGPAPARVVVARSADEFPLRGHPGRRSVVEALLKCAMLVGGPATK